MASPRNESLGEPIERFKPTTGLASGYLGLLLAAAVLVYVVSAVHTVVGVRLGLGAVLLGLLVWVSQLRPRVTAYPAVLKLQGLVRDVFVPYEVIGEVTVTQMLHVFVGDTKFVCVGVGNTLSADVRERAKQRRGAMRGATRRHEFDEHSRLAQSSTGLTYQDFVTTRIEHLVQQARREKGPVDDAVETPESRVRTRWAVPEIAAIVVSGSAFLVACLV